jgi:ssDNA-binding Zn-finger/Zn-ribbon topoisomerase 1
MKREILYSAALDNQGKLIRVAEAEKGTDYRCPVCGTQLILKKSNRTGKGTRRPHFSHSQLTSNCTPEGVLHYSFKKLLTAHLEKCLSENRPLEFGWTCSDCKSKMLGNLLKHVVKVKEEYDLSVCRPDIALLDRNENVIAVIEVVVTHAPEEKVIQYYREGNVVLVQINLSSDTDLNEVEARIRTPNLVDYCMNRRCSNYAASTIERLIQINLTSCGRCFAPLERYSILAKGRFGERSLQDFSEHEIDQLKTRSSRVTVYREPSNNERHPVFTCERCMRLAHRYGRRSPRL